MIEGVGKKIAPPEWRLKHVCGAALGLTLLAGGAMGQEATDWAFYHGNPAGDHYSELMQIGPQNVAKLAPAWRIDTGEGGLQTTPLVIAGVLYAMTPNQTVLAVDAATGRELWRRALPDANLQPVRGLSYWTQGSEKRLLVGAGNYLHALDPATGAPLDGFGDHGRIDLRAGLGRVAEGGEGR